MRFPTGKFLAVVLIAAFAARLAAGWWWQARLDRSHRGPFGFGDSDGYWTLARAIARGEPYKYGAEGFRVFRTPGYPILLAPIFLLAGDEPSVMWGRALSALLDTLTAAGVGWLAWRLFDRRTGALATVLAAFFPGSIAVGMLVLSEAPFCPLMILNLGLWMAAWKAASRSRGTWLAIAAGLAAGAATLVRPSWLLFTPFAVAVGLVFGKPRLRHLGLGAAMAAGLIAAMVPWWVRNARVTGRFVPTSLQVGANLYDGWNPGSTGAGDWEIIERFRADLKKRAVAGRFGEPPGVDWEYWLDRRHAAEAIAGARAHPGRVLELAASKLVRMWDVFPHEPSFSAWPVRLGVAGTYVPVMVLAIWGAARTLRRGWPYVLCWLPAAYFTLLHMVFDSSIRYRQPAMLLLMVLAAGVVEGMGARCDRRGARDEGREMRNEGRETSEAPITKGSFPSSRA